MFVKKKKTVRFQIIIVLVIFMVMMIGCELFQYRAFAQQENVASEESSSEITPDWVVKSSITAHRANSEYHGKETTTNLKPEDIIDFKVIDSGGIKQDGHGDYVFSNYATLSIAIKCFLYLFP